MQLLGCDHSTCENRGHYCWQPDGKTHRHYRISNYHTGPWNRALQHTTKPEYVGTTLTNPPEKLKTKMMAWYAAAMDAKGKQKVELDKVKEAPTTLQLAQPLQTPQSTGITSSFLENAVLELLRERQTPK